MMALHCKADGADVKIDWDPPNATPLEQIPFLKYSIYLGVNGGSITNLLTVTTNRTYTITNMVPGNYQLVAKAINIWGMESPPSNVLSLPSATPPGAPATFRAILSGTFNIEVR